VKTTILIHCPDQSGIICNVTGFIHNEGGNIIYIDQHVDKESGELFMRLESEFSEKEFTIDNFKSKFNTDLANKFKIKWSIHTDETKPKMALFVSKYNHCLYDLLSRWRFLLS